MIFMVIVLTIGGQDLERREPMPTAAACFSRAREAWDMLTKQHPEATEIGIGCIRADGDPV